MCKPGDKLAETSYDEPWSHFAAALRAARDAQRRAWGGLDDTTVARFIAGEATEDERGWVERVLREHPKVREWITEIRQIAEVPHPAPVLTASEMVVDPGSVPRAEESIVVGTWSGQIGEASPSQVTQAGYGDASSDLLVVVLAILTDAVPRYAVATALKSWTEEKQQPLSQWLKHSAGLDDQRFRALEFLASAHLKAHEYDIRLSLDAWNAFELTKDVLTEISDDALRATLGASLGRETALSSLPGTDSVSAPLATTFWLRDREGERFQLIRPYAKGGIGQVWVARDCELQRNVALKEIQPRFAEREDHRARFVLEAEVTGNLEHPGIVPVYSLGRSADGRPYYAMRFIQGESLSVAIRKFHEGRRAADAEIATQRPQWGVEFRQLLGRFLDVCDAMDYAHSRGVLHRDLKPANIMLGKYGETLVVDWGLAKVMGKDDVIPAAAEADFEPSIAGFSVTTSGDAQPGTTIGTPRYMSPEQARGELDNLGYTSDVYSLGATLYELLTGQVAFRGRAVEEVFGRVVRGEFVPPREVDHSIPPALEAVCKKAMAREPHERYLSVRELARDVESWLGDEPVTAYRERTVERFGRFLRRNSSWTTALVAGVIVATIAVACLAFALEMARRREGRARREAEYNYAKAREAVERFRGRMGEGKFLEKQDSKAGPELQK
jgi:serine/threonine-protein kinase